MARLIYIDNLRSALSVLVVGHHSALAVSGLGSWYFSVSEPHLEEPIASAVVATLLFTTQAFLTGLLFLIAGLLTPRSLAEKGAWKYFLGRLWRLALPALLVGLPVHHFSQWLGDQFSGGEASTLDFRLSSGPGVAWFELWLLAFETVFLLVSPKQARRALKSVGRSVNLGSIFLCVVFLAFVQFAVEMHVAKPLASVFPHWRGLSHHIIHTPLYGFCFGCGSLCETSLLTMLSAHARPLGIACALSMGLCFLFALGRDQTQPERASNSLAVAIGALMTVSVCAGASIRLLVAFEAYFSKRSLLSDLSGLSYAVNLLHPMIVVLLTPLVATLSLGLISQIAILWASSAAVSYGVAGLIRCISIV